MTFNKYILISGIGILLAGCTSYNVPQSHTLQFDTRLVGPALKQFKIHMQPKFVTTGIDTTSALKAKRQSGLANFKDERNRDLKTQKILLTQLNATLKETNYCKDGYWIIDTNVHTNAPFLLGECNDAATPDDKTRIKNTIKQW